MGQELRERQQKKKKKQSEGESPTWRQPPSPQPDQKSAERNAADYRTKILTFIRMHGPSLPNEVRREIGKDTIITSAMLSEMVSKKLIKLTHLKVGTSPLYYIKGQENQLLRFVDHLHEREREALEHLKEEEVVRDVDLMPVQRVAMRDLKDFAVPITVTLHDHKELFWKWYLTKNEDLSEKVKLLMPKPEVKSEPKPKPLAPETKPEPKAEPPQPRVEPKVKAPEKKEDTKDKELPKKPATDLQAVRSEAVKKPTPDKEVKDRFYQRIRTYCEERGITIISAKVIRKNSELNLTLQVPSAIGTLTYYAKAKSKKKASDADLAATLVEAQSLRLPALFLTPGKLTKKAQQKLNKEFKELLVKNL